MSIQILEHKINKPQVRLEIRRNYISPRGVADMYNSIIAKAVLINAFRNIHDEYLVRNWIKTHKYRYR